MSNLVQEKLIEFFDAHEIGAITLSKKEKWRIQQQWREVFARNVKSTTGKWVVGDCDWHAFSYNMEPSLRGGRAWAAFNEITIDNFFFISSNDEISAYFCKYNGRLEANYFADLLLKIPELVDIYLFSQDFEWTLVLVHEPDMGPFFSERRLVDH